jgi:long-subunit fatty acid transport protein
MFLHQNVPSSTLYIYESNPGTRGLCPGPQNLSLEGEKNLKIDIPITIFSQITCTPEKGVPNFLMNKKKNEQFMFGMNVYT